MTSITPLKHSEALRHLEHAAALSLLQAIHRHLEPEAVIRVLWSHAATLIGTTGLHYRHTGQDLTFDYGDGRHTASYTLTHEGEDLGKVTLRFQRRVDEAVLNTAEDLLALTMPALRNALAHDEVCRRAERTSDVVVTQAPVRRLPVRPAPRLVGGTAARGNDRDDALVLVGLDGFDDIRTAHGEAWAQTLVQSIQKQIREGLRDADSVFQIDEGLLAVLLPHTSEEAAVDVAGKVRVLISGLHLRDGSITSQLTACMGVVGARDAGAPDDVLDQARAALSQARQEGRSSIRAYSAL